MIDSAVTFAVVLPTLLVAHQVGDHWIQTSWQAENKGRQNSIGRLACAMHVASCTLTAIVLVVVAWQLFYLSINLIGLLLGQLVSAVTHYWAGRRFALELLCGWLGKGNFYRLGIPREVHATDKTAWPVVLRAGSVHAEGGREVPWGNPSPGTGAYALDQSWHLFWLFVSAVVTATI